MSTESLDETHHTEVAPSHAQMIEQLLHDAPHRPAPEGVRIVALWWIEHLRETRESHADAYLALRGLRSTLRENRELLSDAPLKRGMRHLQELDSALDAVCTAAAERAWLESEADMLLPDAAAEAQELSDLLEDEHQQLERRAATALRKHFDAFDQIAQSALPHFTVHGTVGVSLN
ncbi:MAG: hypothetical protein H7Z40_13080, partial [Phycisphaerae bacterium]|nr:hypothetical protein [Gemmatimonadaceae bacterium]